MHEISRNAHSRWIFMVLASQKSLILCSPHPYLRFSYSFRPMGESATFLFATQVDYLGVWKVLTKALNHVFSTVEHLRLGAIAFRPENLYSPNDDFGRMNEHSGTYFILPKRRIWKAEQTLGTYFQGTFHIREYWVWATFIWKVLWKMRSRIFDRPSKFFVWGA